MKRVYNTEHYYNYQPKPNSFSLSSGDSTLLKDQLNNTHSSKTGHMRSGSPNNLISNSKPSPQTHNSSTLSLFLSLSLLSLLLKQKARSWNQALLKRTNASWRSPAQLQLHQLIPSHEVGSLFPWLVTFRNYTASHSAGRQRKNVLATNSGWKHLLRLNWPERSHNFRPLIQHKQRPGGHGAVESNPSL